MPEFHAPAPAPGPEDRFLEPDAPGQARLALDFAPAASGGAPVWVFLHGLGSDRGGAKAVRFGAWARSRGHGFLALDFTGHGGSGGDCRGLALSRNLEDTGRAVSFLNREAAGSPVLLIGSSMGGIAALWYAALHPERVRRVFAIAPAFRMAERLAASLSQPERRAWARRGFLSFPVGETALEFGWDAVTDEARYPTERLAAELRTPAVLLHGSEDAVVPVELSRDFAEECAAAELVEIEDGDHRLTEHRDFLFEAMWSSLGGSGAGPEAGRAPI